MEELKWGPLILTESERSPVLAPPFTQSNTHSVFRTTRIAAGSDISQQLRFVFQNKSQSFSVSAWSLITSTQWKNDLTDSNIVLNTLFDKYIENAIYIEYQNTAGNVYMQPVYLTNERLYFPSLAMSAYLGSTITGPIDMCNAYQEGVYNIFRPSSYTAYNGIGVSCNSISNYVGASTQIYGIVSATYTPVSNAIWNITISKYNSSTSSVNIVQIQSLGSGYYMLLNDLMVNIQGFTYILSVNIQNQNGVILQTYPNVDITAYIGYIVYASRSSGITAQAPIIESNGTGQSFQLKLEGIYDSNKKLNPTNNTAQTNFIKLKAEVTLDNDTLPLVQKVLTVWQNFDYPQGYTQLSTAVEINEGLNTIYLQTFNPNLPYQFNPVYLSSILTASDRLQFNINAKTGSNAVIQSQFTAQNTSGTDLSTLISGALLNPNTWVSYGTYFYTIPSTYSYKTSSLSVRLYSYYDTFVPPPPPPPPEPVLQDFGYQEIVENNAFETIQEHIYKGSPRDLVRDPDDKPYMKDSLSQTFREQFLFDGAAGKEIYNLIYQIDPDFILKAKNMGEIIDKIITEKTGYFSNSLKNNWLFGNSQNLARIDRKRKPRSYFTGPTAGGSRDDTFYRYTNLSKKEPVKSEMSLQEIIYNAQYDKRFFDLIGESREQPYASPYTAYGLPFNPFNATESAYLSGRKRKFGDLSEAGLVPAYDELFDVDLNQVYKLTDAQIQELSIQRGWLGSLLHSTPVLGVAQLIKSLVTFDFSPQLNTLMYNYILPGLVVHQFSKIATKFFYSNSIEVLPGSLAIIPQETMYQKGERYFSRACALAFLAHSTGMTQVFYGMAHRYFVGPTVLESTHNMMFGDTLTTTQKVLLTTLENNMVSDFGKFIEYGALATKMMFPESKFLITPETVVLITRIGSLAGVITNPVVQIGAVGTAAYYFYRKLEQTQQNIDQEVQQKSKIVIKELDEFAKNTIQNEQRKVIETQLFIEQLQRAFQQSLLEQQQKGDDALNNLNVALGYVPNYIKNQQTEAINQFQQIFDKTEEQIENVKPDIYDFLDKNQDILKIAGLLGLFAGAGTTAYLINKQYQEIRRQQDKEDLERKQEQIRQKREERLKEEKRKKAEVEFEIQRRKQKREQLLRKERIQEFERMIKQSQEAVELRNLQQQTTPYTYQNQSQTDKIPFKTKIEIYSQLVIANETRGAVEDETQHLTNSSLCQTSDGRSLFIHAFSNLINNMPTIFDTYDPLQSSIALSAVDAFLKQSMYYQKLANDTHAFVTFKLFKSIINPENSVEEIIQEQLKAYAGINRKVDSKIVISDQKKSKIEEVADMVQQKEKISSLIERLVSNSSSSHQQAFNGATYIVSQMRSLGYAPPKRLSRQEEAKIRIKKAFRNVTDGSKVIQKISNRLNRRKKDEDNFMFDNAQRRLRQLN